LVGNDGRSAYRSRGDDGEEAALIKKRKVVVASEFRAGGRPQGGISGRGLSGIGKKGVNRGSNSAE